MTLTLDAEGLLDKIRGEFDRTALRARNGLKHVAGIGRPAVACSPNELVWQRDRARLYRYTSAGPRVAPPVLLVMSLVTKPYVFDLQPGNSFVETLLRRDFDVYVLDWGIPDAADSANSFETYCDEYLPLAADAVLRESGSDGLTVYGYCLGGLLSLMFVAAHPEVPVRSVGVMATPIDFSMLGSLPHLFRAGRLRPADMLDETGNVPPEVVFDCVRSFAPVPSATAYANLLENLDSGEFLAAYEALMDWAKDHLPFPGACFQQLADWFLCENQLLTGRFRVGGRDVDLRTIACPVLNVVGEKDHLVPPSSSAPLAKLIPHLDELRFDCGHVGLIVGRSAQKHSIPAIVGWLEHDIRRN